MYWSGQIQCIYWSTPSFWSMSTGVSRNLLMFNHQQCKSWHLQETLYWPWLWSCVCSYSGKVVMSASQLAIISVYIKSSFSQTFFFFLLQCVGSKYSVRSINNKTTSKLANCKDEKKLTVIHICNITILQQNLKQAKLTFMKNKHYVLVNHITTL